MHSSKHAKDDSMKNGEKGFLMAGPVAMLQSRLRKRSTGAGREGLLKEKSGVMGGGVLVVGALGVLGF